MLKARITGSPVKISLETRLILSIKACNFLNLGIAIINKMLIMPNIMTKARPITHAIEILLLFKIFIKAPIPIIGEYIRTLNISVIKLCICCMSFVLRVIKEATENFENSFAPKLKTFLNTLFLKTFPSLAATRADNSIMSTAAIILINATPSISNPSFKIYSFCSAVKSIPLATYSAFTV